MEYLIKFSKKTTWYGFRLLPFVGWKVNLWPLLRARLLFLQKELFAGASESALLARTAVHAQCPGESLGERKCKNECVNSCMDCVFAFLPGAVLKRVQVFTYFSQIPVGQVRKLRHRKSQVIWPSSYSNSKLYSGAMLLRREGVLRLWSLQKCFCVWRLVCCPQLLLGVIVRSSHVKPVIVHVMRIIWENSVWHNVFFVRTPRRNFSQFFIKRVGKLPEQISLLLFPGCCQLPPLSSSLER